MSKRLPCPPAPGPLEDYAQSFDDLFGTLAQRRGFREYLTGLLLPRDRNKALTALAGMEPIVGAQGAPAQRLQFFLSESAWDLEAVNARRVGRYQPNADFFNTLASSKERHQPTLPGRFSAEVPGSL
jgi:SRSO17 transposase